METTGIVAVAKRNGNTTGKKYSCKLCRKDGHQFGFDNRTELIAHYLATHPDFKIYRGRRKPATPAGPTKPEEGAIEAVYAAERVLREHVKGLDAERNRLQSRLLELDNIIAKYRKV